MNAAETLRHAERGIRNEGAMGHAIADWFAGILSPVGLRATTASDDEVRHALLIAKAHLESGS